MQNAADHRTTPARRYRRRRVAVGVGLALTLAIAVGGCGGGGSSSDGGAATTSAQGSDDEATTTAGFGGGDTSASTIEGAKVRIVNLYVPADGTPGAVDVLPGYTAGEDAKAVNTIAFGEAGEYFAPPATSDGRSVFSIYPEGATSDDDRLMQVDQTIVEGDQVTILLTSGDDLEGKRTGSTQLFWEAAGPESGTEATEPAPDGKGLLLGNASAIENIGGDPSGFTYGTPGSGCLEDEDESSTLVGGTSTLRYPVEPGDVEVAAYAFDDNECSGEPQVGPDRITLDAGESAYAFVYGADPADLKFLLVPIET